MKKINVNKVLHGILMLFCIAIVLSLSQGAEAVKFKVNSTDDIGDAFPGNGVCETASGNNICTLRAAVQEANAFAGADEIRLKAATYSLTLTGTGEDLAATGDLDITDSLTIKGKGAALTVVDGNHSDRVFHIIGPGPVVNFIALKVANGSLGAGDFAGGGIYNSGANVTVNSCTITNNVFYGQVGGGILSMNGNLKVVASRVIQNGIFYTGSAVAGGGIASLLDTSVKIIRTKVADNFAANIADTAATNDIAVGGGIAIEGTNTVKIKSCKILGNGAYAWTTDLYGASGAGLLMAEVPIANIIDTKIANNTCSGLMGYGGGVFALSANATFSGCLITENSILGGSGFGGGMYLEYGGGDPMTITITNQSSVTYNYAFSGGGIYVAPALIEFFTLNISADSVVANNLRNDIG